MRSQAERQYIVHLDVRATAQDPADAVQAALEQVLRGGLGDVSSSVEETGPVAQLAAAGHRSTSVGAAGHVGGVRRDGRHNRYPNEFLG